mgnify:CR=1 FL=1
MIQNVVDEIKKANTILLTTHRQCDGDGLGSELAMYHALKKIGKNVRIINVDETPQKYDFLNPDEYIQYFDSKYDPIEKSELALIFDTNDKRLIEPLYKTIETQCDNIIFVDHHPVLTNGPSPTNQSIINVNAASTGELAYDIITALEIPLDENIAKALYTSIVFDTQLFRYVRNSPRSHEVAAVLLQYEKNPAEVHKKLFGNFTAAKLKFLAQALSHIEFFNDDQIALLLIKTKDLESMGLHIDDSRDLIDMIMNIESVEAAAVFREDASNVYKLSLRSKGIFPILEIAETVGGGGHPYASGASLNGDYEELSQKILQSLKDKVNNYSK